MIQLRMLFEPDISGHHIEYIHHIYVMARSKSECRYIFVVPENFDICNTQYNWPEANNIEFDYIPISDIDRLKGCNLVKSSYRHSKLLSRYVNKFKVSHVFLISLIFYIPFLPFLVSKKVNVIGILYKIYLYEWNSYSWHRKALEILKYKTISFNNCIKTVFVLNDSPSAELFNKLYKTNKFNFLIDPYNNFSYAPHDLRKEMGIPDNKQVFIHMGAMNMRKGTLTILKSIALMSQKERDKFALVIAGVVRSEIKKEFYELYNFLKDSCQIIVYDEFCSREFMSDLCFTCDCMLIPYGVTAQSSGLIGYAAYYHKPVIGPGSGLVGKLIRTYRLGTHIKDVNPNSLAKAMTDFESYRTDSPYCEYATIDKFQKQISAYF